MIRHRKARLPASERSGVARGVLPRLVQRVVELDVGLRHRSRLPLLLGRIEKRQQGRWRVDRDRRFGEIPFIARGDRANLHLTGRGRDHGILKVAHLAFDSPRSTAPVTGATSRIERMAYTCRRASSSPTALRAR